MFNLSASGVLAFESCCFFFLPIDNFGSDFAKYRRLVEKNTQLFLISFEHSFN
jgi:hypothetical protein